MMMKAATALLLFLVSPQASLGLERNRIAVDSTFGGGNEAKTEDEFYFGVQRKTAKADGDVFHFANFFSDVESDLLLNDMDFTDRFMKGHVMSMSFSLSMSMSFDMPEAEPTDMPEAEPTDMPVSMPVPDDVPEAEPTDMPVSMPVPDDVPEAEPTDMPVSMPVPDDVPEAEPTDMPVMTPTNMPTSEPTQQEFPLGPGIEDAIEEGCAELESGSLKLPIDVPDTEEVEIIFYFEAQTSTDDFSKYTSGGLDGIASIVAQVLCGQQDRRLLAAHHIARRRLDLKGVSSDFEFTNSTGCPVTADGAEYCYTVGVRFILLVTPDENKDTVKQSVLDLVQAFGENDKPILEKYAPEIIDLTYLGTDAPDGITPLSVSQDSQGMSTSSVIAASAGAAGLVAIALAAYAFRQRSSPNGELLKPEFDDIVDDDSSTVVSTNSERNCRDIESFNSSIITSSSPLEDIPEENDDAAAGNSTHSTDEEDMQEVDLDKTKHGIQQADEEQTPAGIIEFSR